MYCEIQQSIVFFNKLLHQRFATTHRRLPTLSDNDFDEEPLQTPHAQGSKRRFQSHLMQPTSPPPQQVSTSIDSNTIRSLVTSTSYMTIGNNNVPVSNIQQMYDSTNDYKEGQFEAIRTRLETEGYLLLRGFISRDDIDKALELIKHQLSSRIDRQEKNKKWKQGCTINMQTGR
jgi:hypothetical protein